MCWPERPNWPRSGPAEWAWNSSGASPETANAGTERPNWRSLFRWSGRRRDGNRLWMMGDRGEGVVQQLQHLGGFGRCDAQGGAEQQVVAASAV